jgi:hypothetical protein
MDYLLIQASCFIPLMYYCKVCFAVKMHDTLFSRDMGLFDLNTRGLMCRCRYTVMDPLEPPVRIGH